MPIKLKVDKTVTLKNSTMKFSNPLVHGTLVKRYKRFLADVTLDSGEVVVAHCTNSGSMKSCLENGAEVYLSPAADPNRKTRFTWEMIKIDGSWVGINTANPNQFGYEALVNNLIPGLQGYTEVKREVTFDDSRFDLYARNASEECFVEVKNVSLKEGNLAMFPDAVTTRGQKHLETLVKAKQQGYRAAMLYIIQRTDVEAFAPASHIDPEYARKLKAAIAQGIEVYPLMVAVSPTEIKAIKLLELKL
jgi:sugar fermentation stimulation protein